MEIAALTDTITVFLRDTLTQSNLIEPYRELIESQRATYNFILIAFLGILGLFTAITWIYYFKISRRQIRKNAQKIFDEERSNIISSIKEEYDKKFTKLEDSLNKRFLVIEATSSRLFAIALPDKDSEDIANKVAWWMRALEEYIELNEGYFTNVSIEAIIELLERLNSDEILKQGYIVNNKDFIKQGFNYSYEYFIKIVNKIPDTLTDKRIKIKDFFDSIKGEISEGEKDKETKPDSTNN